MDINYKLALWNNRDYDATAQHDSAQYAAFREESRPWRSTPMPIALGHRGEMSGTTNTMLAWFTILNAKNATHPLVFRRWKL
jgi:hypothetical protein